jgi:hypothetical protein
MSAQEEAVANQAERAAALQQEGHGHGHGHGGGAAAAASDAGGHHAHGHDADGNCQGGGGGGGGGHGHGHGHGQQPQSQQQAQQAAAAAGPMITSVVAMVPDISKPLDGRDPVPVTQQQMQQIQMMGQMMANMIMSAVGKAFQNMTQADLTEEQKKIADDSMALAETQRDNMVEAQMTMERAMGKVLNRLEPEQVEKWSKHVKSFVEANVPGNDDTTKAYLWIGTKIREDELKMKALTTDEEEATAKEARTKAMALAQQGTPEAQAQAQQIIFAANKELEKTYNDEFNKAKEAFMVRLNEFRYCQYYQCCVQVSMTMQQQMMMGRGQQEAMRQPSKAKQMEIMERCQVQLHASFTEKQCELFLTFRKNLSNYGGVDFIDAETTARTEARLAAKKAAEPEPEAASDQGWGAWIADSVNSVASAVGAVLGDEVRAACPPARVPTCLAATLISFFGRPVWRMPCVALLIRVCVRVSVRVFVRVCVRAGWLENRTRSRTHRLWLQRRPRRTACLPATAPAWSLKRAPVSGRAVRISRCATACLALPCLALPCLALPCLALPCLALPCLALPCLPACPQHTCTPGSI